jgi:hypothetical protein
LHPLSQALGSTIRSTPSYYGDHLSHDGTLPWAAGIHAIRERFQQVAAIVPANLDGFRKKAQLSELYARKRPRPTCAGLAAALGPLAEAGRR